MDTPGRVVVGYTEVAGVVGGVVVTAVAGTVVAGRPVVAGVIDGTGPVFEAVAPVPGATPPTPAVEPMAAEPVVLVEAPARPAPTATI